MALKRDDTITVPDHTGGVLWFVLDVNGADEVVTADTLLFGRRIERAFPFRVVIPSGPGSWDEEVESWVMLERLDQLRGLLSEPEVSFESDHGRFGFVSTDASFRDGVAGLGVAGALGEHSRRARAASSTHAEMLALEWAMEIAREADRRDLMFCTDCSAVFQTLGVRYDGERYTSLGPRDRGWFLSRIPRAQNRRADLLASLSLAKADTNDRATSSVQCQL